MALTKVAGSRLYIGGRVAYKSVVQLSDFAGQVWVPINKWTQSGDIGAEQEAITQTLIDQNATLYAKGVISFPIMENVFVPDPTDPGQIAFKLAQISCKPYAFKVEWDAACGAESTVTISSASPGVVSWNAHGLANGTPVTFSTTGSLPSPLVPGVTYFVVNQSTNAFNVEATIGGGAIDTLTAGSGTHIARAQTPGETDLFLGLAMLGNKTGGDESATRLINFPIQPICRHIEV